MDLNEIQLAAVRSRHAINLVLAGPGSGKTRTIVERIIHLIGRGTKPAEIVAITYTNAAAREIEDRVQKALVGKPELGFIGTLHGFMLKLLNEQTQDRDFPIRAPFTVMDEDATEELLHEVIRRQRFKGSLAEAASFCAQGPPLPAGHYSAAQRVASEYHGAMQGANMLDFDAILYYGLKLVQVLGNLPYKHLLVDEFQDSADEDAAIYRALKIPNKLYCGDPDQAIFGFRGGRVDNIIHLEDTTGVESFRLEYNYRSGGDICATAQKLIEHNEKRVKKRTISMTGTTGSVELFVFQHHLEEIVGVAGMVNRLWVQGERSIAVLCRTNYLVDQFGEAMRAAGLPIATKQRPTIPEDWKTAKLLLAVLANPECDHAMLRYLKARYGEQFALEAKNTALADYTTVNQAKMHWETPTNLIDVLERIQSEGILPDSRARIFETSSKLPVEANVNDLILALSREELSQKEEGLGITLTTCHAAKGREWDNVFLPAFEQGIIPNANRDTDLEEERRLAYVAITRARHRLAITHAHQRMGQWDQGAKPATPSQFLYEMDLIH